MNITTKFSNGDSVHFATCKERTVRGQCPDCNGTGRMKVEGRALTLACVDCHGRGDIIIGSTWVADVRPLTIGQVRVEITESKGFGGYYGASNFSPQSRYFEQYMAEETGICSGSIYDAKNLFVTEAEALERGAIIAFEVNARHEEIARRREAERLKYEAEFEQEQEPT